LREIAKSYHSSAYTGKQVHEYQSRTPVDNRKVL
jgi:hypothetical protein